METREGFPLSGGATAPPTRDISRTSRRVCWRGKESHQRPRRRMDTTQPYWIPGLGTEGVEKENLRRVLCEPEAAPEGTGSDTGGIVRCSRRERGRPDVRVEIQSSRVDASRGRSAGIGSSRSGIGVWAPNQHSGDSSPSPSRRQTRGRVWSKEDSRESTRERHGEKEHVELEGLFIRPRFQEASHRVEKKAREEQQLREFRGNSEPRSLRSGRSVSRRGSSKAYRSEMPGASYPIRHQGGQEEIADRDRRRRRRADTESSVCEILQASDRAFGGIDPYEERVFDSSDMPRCYARRQHIEVPRCGSAAPQIHRADIPGNPTSVCEPPRTNPRGGCHPSFNRGEPDGGTGAEAGGEGPLLLGPQRKGQDGFLLASTLGGRCAKRRQREQIGEGKSEGEGAVEGAPSEGSSSCSERSHSVEGVASVISVSDSNPPSEREGESDTLPCDLSGPVGRLGPLLCRWFHLHVQVSGDATHSRSSKQHSTAEVFPLPMPPRGSPLAVHPWMEATVRALNWLTTGEASLAEEPANTMQNSLLQVLVHSLRVLSELEACTFDTVPIETYWRSRSVNGYGEEVHSALSFCWANVEHSLPQRDVAGVLDATEICSGGVRDFIVDPFKYLKPDCARAWMRPPRVMVSTDEWSAVASGLVDRGICDVIPLREVLHVDGKPVLGGLFGVPKMEEVSGIPVLRLIMDLRPINQLFEAIAGDLHTLPMLSQLFPLELFPHENVIVSSEDIKAMFYIVGLPEAWRPLLAFGREVPEILRPAGCSEPCVLTSRVLPMGFVNSVAIAQGLHRNIVNQAVDRFGFSREQEIRKDQSLPAASLAYRVYLDNFDSLYRTNREAADLLAGSLSPLTAGLREIYEELKVPINEKKSVKSALRAEMQGGLIDGVGGIIAPKPDKIARYLRGAWYLLQSKTADLKRVQTVAGGLVYLFSYRRCLMSCLNEIWSFISSFEGKLRVWKTIPPRVKMEIFSSIALCPLAYMDLRCAYDPIVTASDASESGGGLSYSSGLTEFGVQAMSKNIRGLNDSISDDNQVLVISLFDGIGACRVALDLIGAKVAGYVAIEPDAAARRVVECAFGSTEFVTSVTLLTDEVVRSWTCKYSRASLILLVAGAPCQSSAVSSDKTETDNQFRCLCREIPQIQGLLKRHFVWAELFVLVQSLTSTPLTDRQSMTRCMGFLPYELDASGITPCRQARMFWFNWQAQGEEGVQISRPLTATSHDFGRIEFLLDSAPEPYLTPGWSLAGGAGHKLPCFATSRPKASPDKSSPGIESCSDRDLEYWGLDRFRFPAYQYKFQHGLLHHKHGWRLPNLKEREAMLGFPLDFTLECWNKSQRKSKPLEHEDCRLSLLGHACAVPVMAFLLCQLLQPRGLCEAFTANDIQQRCQPGNSEALGTFLNRPPWEGGRQKVASENNATLIRKLGSLMSTRGTDVLLQAPSEPSQSNDRLRTSVPSRLWKWSTACGWTWKRFQVDDKEHINRLELRAVLTAIKWRALKAKQANRRFLHLVDSLVSLHVVNKGRSSSRRLRPILKKISAYLLLSANSCILGYVNTSQNPADAPSRRGQKRKWAKAK